MKRNVNTRDLPSGSDGSLGWLETYNQNFFFYLEKNPQNIDIIDISHGLSNLCRFTGQCNEFYSVAQHSCIVHDNAPEHLMLEGLLHDASEAYISDIPRPVKGIIPQIKELEITIQMQISERFKLSFPFTGRIEILDTQLMLREAQELFSQQVSWEIEGVDPLDIIIGPCWEPKIAKAEFLRRFDNHMEYKDGEYFRKHEYI